MIPPAASQGMTRASVSSSLPANSGRKTSGPSAAPKSAPKSTSDIPRARRAGGNMSAAAVRASSTVPCATPTSAKPVTTIVADSTSQPSAVTTQPTMPATQPPARTGIRPTWSISLPAGKRGQRRGDEEDRRPEAQDPLDARDEDERDGRDGDRQLHHAGEARQGGCQQDDVPADRELVHEPSLDDGCGQPGTKRCCAAA